MRPDVEVLPFGGRDEGEGEEDGGDFEGENGDVEGENGDAGILLGSWAQ
jgi:hypothetical protein